MRILKTIAMEEIKSVNLQYTQEQLDEVLKRLQNNQEVVKDIAGMIKDQGNNLEEV